MSPAILSEPLKLFGLTSVEAGLARTLRYQFGKGKLMPDQFHPTSEALAPDPSNNYERSHPGRESGQGRMDPPETDPPRKSDRQTDAVHNTSDNTKPINSDPSAHGQTHSAERGKQVSDLPVPDSIAPEQPNHSMKDEEPTGWDQAPQGRMPTEHQRHPRTGGKGGTPDVGESKTNG